MLSITAPRCDETGYRHWALAIQRTAAFLRTRLREIQLVASVPLPHRNADVYHMGRRWLGEDGIYPFLVAGGFWKSMESAFVQLVYPWVRTAGAATLPEGLESPDAVLTGVIARNTLLRGAFRSAAGLRLTGVDDVHPIVGRGDLEARPPVAALRGIDTLGMIERVSVLGPTPGGLKVLSDVTTAPNESYRQAGVNRLFSVLVRAARRTGEATMFEPSNERTWVALRRRLENLLLRFFRAGAFRGQQPREAFSVRCDRTTMTQNDLDNGRIIAHLEFDAAPSIERIRVVLTLSEGGQVSLSAGGMT
jgi:phage tail sheath protein FI